MLTRKVKVKFTRRSKKNCSLLNWLIRNGDQLQEQCTSSVPSLGFYDAKHRTILLKPTVIESESAKENNQTKEIRLVNFLLHQMVHAFFSLYSCSCQDCVDKVAPSLGGLGPRHGIPRLEAMVYVELALGNLVSWKVATTDAESIALKMAMSCWVPKLHQLERWLRNDKESIRKVFALSAVKFASDGVWLQQRKIAFEQKVQEQLAPEKMVQQLGSEQCQLEQEEQQEHPEHE
ncbi:hypothetical protein B0J14DRAFT_582087 [Halenospora varia]|nr:hypothetical protein B0J14DRAFT_582087 [Halenospora varia]